MRYKFKLFKKNKNKTKKQTKKMGMCKKALSESLPEKNKIKKQK